MSKWIIFPFLLYTVYSVPVLNNSTDEHSGSLESQDNNLVSSTSFGISTSTVLFTDLTTSVGGNVAHKHMTDPQLGETETSITGASTSSAPDSFSKQTSSANPSAVSELEAASTTSDPSSTDKKEEPSTDPVKGEEHASADLKTSDVKRSAEVTNSKEDDHSNSVTPLNDSDSTALSSTTASESPTVSSTIIESSRLSTAPTLSTEADTSKALFITSDPTLLQSTSNSFITASRNLQDTSVYTVDSASASQETNVTSTPTSQYVSGPQISLNLLFPENNAGL